MLRNHLLRRVLQTIRSVECVLTRKMTNCSVTACWHNAEWPWVTCRCSHFLFGKTDSLAQSSIISHPSNRKQDHGAYSAFPNNDALNSPFSATFSAPWQSGPLWSGATLLTIISWGKTAHESIQFIYTVPVHNNHLQTLPSDTNVQKIHMSSTLWQWGGRTSFKQEETLKVCLPFYFQKSRNHK